LLPHHQKEEKEEATIGSIDTRHNAFTAGRSHDEEDEAAAAIVVIVAFERQNYQNEDTSRTASYDVVATEENTIVRY
jgi:hypothetical protein